MEIRNRLKKLLDESGFSIRQISQRSGVRRQSIMRFLNGGNIHIKNLEKLLASLGYDLKLAKFEGEKEPAIPVFYSRINTAKEQIEKFCRRNGIVYLALFGSVLRDDFKKDSDIDIIIKLNRDLSFFELAEIEEGLKNLFKTEHKIDLLTERSISPLIKESILDNQEIIYEKAA